MTTEVASMESMDTFYLLVAFVVVLAAAIYIAKAWSQAKHRRDAAFATRPAAGISPGEREPSAFPYLLK